MAEISVPAWPIPIHHTKFVMANPHITGNADAPDADAFGEKQRHRQQEHQQQADARRKPPNQKSGVRLVSTTVAI